MYPYPYPAGFVPISPVRRQARLREQHARNIGQIEGYGAGVRDLIRARAAEKLKEVEEKPKKVEPEPKAKEEPKKKTAPAPKVTKSAQEKYQEYKKTKDGKKATSAKPKTTEDAFEKYQHYKDKHYEYRGRLQQDPEPSKKEEIKSKETRGAWDSNTAKNKKPDPKDFREVRRKKEREEYYHRKREEEKRAEQEKRERYYEQRRAEEAKHQERFDWYAYEQQREERRAAAGGGQFVRAEPRRRVIGVGRQIWWGERG